MRCYMFQFVNEILSLLLVLSAGIYSGRYMNKFQCVLFIQALVWIFFFLCSYIVTGIQKHYNVQPNNQWVFNIHMLFETSLLMLAAYFYFQEKSVKATVVVVFVFFFFFYCFRIFIYGVKKFDGYIFSMQSLSIMIVYIYIMYDFYINNRFNFSSRSPEIIACIGLLLYTTCNIPFFNLLNFLNVQCPEQSRELFKIITDTSANIRYLSLALALWLIGKNTITINRRRHG
ncbi:MAG: hypothetical protein K0S33_3227 [Bacteroidetes bacterium]|jgi:hypothetical protein|nr:hypothetical protein [Bacteroidota bacterium]